VIRYVYLCAGLRRKLTELFIVLFPVLLSPNCVMLFSVYSTHLYFRDFLEDWKKHSGRDVGHDAPSRETVVIGERRKLPQRPGYRHDLGRNLYTDANTCDLNSICFFLMREFCRVVN